jgi:hypothetical protein
MKFFAKAAKPLWVMFSMMALILKGLGIASVPRPFF